MFGLSASLKFILPTGSIPHMHTSQEDYTLYSIIGSYVKFESALK